MKIKESSILYGDKQIEIVDDEIYKWVKYLTAHGVDFYLLVDREQNKALALKTSAEDASKECQRLSKQLDTTVIFEFIRNNR